jgi:peptidoglycan hydrolase FlgJ
MEVNPIQRQIVASDIAPEQLAGNSRLTEKQKIAEASRQFEAVLLRQILGESQKTVIPSEFSDNSTASGIYQDLITNTLADDISKSGAFGLAKTFEHQLNRSAGSSLKSVHETTTATLRVLPPGIAIAGPEMHVPGGRKSAPPSHYAVSFSAKHP